MPRYISAFLLLIVVSACAPHGAYPPRSVQSLVAGEELAARALSLVGSPYCYGGTTPQGFDCSGLVHYLYRQFDLDVPRTADQLHARAIRVAPDDLRRGDLLFFRLSWRKVTHVGVYVGDNVFVHAPSSGKSVSTARLDAPYWQRHLVGAGRFH